MPKQKNIHERIQILDELLQDRDGYSTEDLKLECELRLENAGKIDLNGGDFSIGINTIRNDMDWIRETYGDVIERIEDGKYKRYRYYDPKFSIYNKMVSPEDLPQIRQIVNYLLRFQGQPMYDWMQDLPKMLHFDEGAELGDESIVGYDTMLYLKGTEWFAKFLNYIINKEAVKLTYQGFGQEPSIIVVHPYYLKQFNRRWYVLAWDGEAVFNYALDRIKDATRADVPFVPNDGKFDPEDFFDDIVGVTRLDKPIEKVRLRVYKESWDYVITKPLHSSQKQPIPDPEGDGGIIRIEVIPNYELEQTILYFGEYMEVLEPQWLREKMAKRIERMNELYK